jgi:hypothetical protein
MSIATTEAAAQKVDRLLFRKLYEYPRDEGNIVDANMFYKIQMELAKRGKLKFLCERDTFFIIEMFDLEAGIYHGRIWNSKKAINYEYHPLSKSNSKSRFDFYKKDKFSRYLGLISNWNTTAIKIGEKEHSLISPNMIYAYRIIFGSTLHIDYISFEDFGVPDSWQK